MAQASDEDVEAEGEVGVEVRAGQGGECGREVGVRSGCRGVT
jgi:hypothetical protein